MILFYLQKKFPKSTNLEVYKFFTKFVINGLFIPILTKPDVGALISEYIISNNTLNNLKIISNIFLKFSSFELYTENDNCNYTPFNIFFINAINKLFEFYTKITEINFPNFIDDLMKGNILSESYKYNYFKEHSDELLFHKSILLTTYQVKVLLENINNMKEKIFNGNNDSDIHKFQNIFERLNKVDKLDLLKEKTTEKITNDANNRELNINYFIISNLYYNNRIEAIFQKIQNKNYFQLENDKNSNNNLDSNDQSLTNIIKAKNILCTILFNYDLLEKTDFVENDKTYCDTISILNKLKLF